MKINLTRKCAALTVALCAMLFFSHRADAQQIAVKTNALYWLGLTPNVCCEIVTGEHTSLDITALGHYMPYGLNSKVFAFQPEFRYWFNGRPMTREFVGGDIMAATYDVMAGGYVYKGNAVMLGLVGGYVFRLSDHWNLELCGGFSQNGEGVY